MDAGRKEVPKEVLGKEDLLALRHALSVEGGAARFYAQAAKLTASPSGRDAFLYLAEQEQKHLDVLEVEIRRFSPAPVEPVEPVVDRPFAPPENALGAVTMAIHEEQDSQSLFLSLKSRCTSPRVRRLFGQLAMDEDRHLAILNEIHEVIGSDRLNNFDFDPSAYGENPLDEFQNERPQARFASHLESLGLRMTTEREKILSEVITRVGHFDVETLFAQMREKGLSVSRATIYRTLDIMMKCGLVRKMWVGEDRFLYESAYARRELPRGVGRRHGHLVCEKCGKVEEFFDETVDAHLEAICWRSNFMARGRSLQVFGLCETCRREGADELPDAR